MGRRPKSEGPAYLRRYTDLPSLLHLLSNKKITFLDPKTWDDQNDSFYMSLYKTEFSLNTLLAICFSQAPETYHHWRVFSNGTAGVCILFDKDRLLKNFDNIQEIKFKKVEYYTLDRAEKRTFVNSELPFVKRWGFKPEEEFRAIYESKIIGPPYLDVDISLDSIRSISLSPWMNTALEDSMVRAIKKIEGCEKLKVSRTTLISNDRWKKMGTAATIQKNNK